MDVRAVKVLIAHNRYRSDAPSGENRVVEQEIELLRDAGVEVTTVIEDSDTIVGPAATAKASLGPVYSIAGVRRFRQALEDSRPDVVHLHNVFPLLSPQVVRAAHDRAIPVVQTVHNYRHSCVNGLQLRDNRPCTSCDGMRLALPALRHGCYRSSRVQTVPMVAGQLVHRRTWRSLDRFLALTPFMAERLASAGIPKQSITVRPTWVPDPGAVLPAAGRDLLFVGRLDEAKGLRLLLEAWRHAKVDGQLLIAGDGPLRSELIEATIADPSVRLLGRLDAAGVSSAMRSACAVVIPSLCFEGLPLVAVEAFAHGRPVVVLEGGSVASVVTENIGWRAPATAGALAAVLTAVGPAEAARRGLAARATYETWHSPYAATRSLLGVYADVVQSRQTATG
jgi:glycosyltransferase involved in cell wall biosynthesis